MANFLTLTGRLNSNCFGEVTSNDFHAGTNKSGTVKIGAIYVGSGDKKGSSMMIYGLGFDDYIFGPQDVYSMKCVSNNTNVKINGQLYHGGSKYQVAFKDGKKAFLNIAANYVDRIENLFADLLYATEPATPLLAPVAAPQATPSVASPVAQAAVQPADDIENKIKAATLLKSMKELLDCGAISQEEFEESRKKFMSSIKVEQENTEQEVKTEEKTEEVKLEEKIVKTEELSALTEKEDVSEVEEEKTVKNENCGEQIVASMKEVAAEIISTIKEVASENAPSEKGEERIRTEYIEKNEKVKYNLMDKIFELAFIIITVTFGILIPAVFYEYEAGYFIGRYDLSCSGFLTDPVHYNISGELVYNPMNSLNLCVSTLLFYAVSLALIITVAWNLTRKNGGQKVFTRNVLIFLQCLFGIIIGFLYDELVLAIIYIVITVLAITVLAIDQVIYMENSKKIE